MYFYVLIKTPRNEYHCDCSGSPHFGHRHQFVRGCAKNQSIRMIRDHHHDSTPCQVWVTLSNLLFDLSVYCDGIIYIEYIKTTKVKSLSLKNRPNGCTNLEKMYTYELFIFSF